MMRADRGTLADRGGPDCSTLDRWERDMMRRLVGTCLLVSAAMAGPAPARAGAADTGTFRCGAGERDITPPSGLPMWGYGARHDLLSVGTLDPLMAKAVVIAAGNDKVAIVCIDLGRGPTDAMMKVIRRQIAEKAGIRHVLITGSHTHHGPVIELTDEEGLGKGKFDEAVAYAKKLPGMLVEAILDADKRL